MVTEHHLEVRRTARYYTYGELTADTKFVWFCLHGYGQLAASMIKKFDDFDPKTHFVVAPEALSRFYWNGFSGKPAASWMTSEDRTHEIKDYVRYLDDVYAKLLKKVDKKQVTINVLGFSQATATVSRWTASGKSIAHNLIFWAGEIARDLDWEKAKQHWQHCRIFSVYGNEDQFVKPEHIESQKARLNEHGLDPTILKFEGKHTVDKAMLGHLVELLSAKPEAEADNLLSNL